MFEITLNSTKKEKRMYRGFYWMDKALRSRGRERKEAFATASMFFFYGGFLHHSNVCKELSLGKRYYPRIIHS